MKEIKKLLSKAKDRNKAGCFVAEGPRMVRETPPELLKELYVTPSFLMEHAGEADSLINRESFAGIREEVSEECMKSLSDTMTPQGILAVVKIPSYTKEEVLGLEKDVPESASGMNPENDFDKARFILALERIQDAGNLGTLFRTAEAAGVTGILMSKDCVDLFSPKVVRSTMGSLYRMPFYITEDFPGTLKELKKTGCALCAALPKATADYASVDYNRDVVLCIGNEGQGLSHEAVEVADLPVTIPMEGKVESLNAAMAGGILMYEVHRCRTHIK